MNYLAQIEYKYYKAPKSEYETGYATNKITIGIFDTLNFACESCNQVLEKLESKFDLHVFPDKTKAKKERFTENEFNRVNLITNLAYLKTPFQFFISITKLKYENIDTTIDNLIEINKEYKLYKENESEN